MLQFKNHPFSRSKFIQCAIDASGEFAAHQVACGIRARPSIRNPIENVILLAARIGRDRSIFLTNLPLAEMIQAEVSYDPVDPCVEGALEAEVTHALVGLKKSLLVNILGFVFRSREVCCKTQHSLIVVPHQLLESSAIAALRFADQ